MLPDKKQSTSISLTTKPICEVYKGQEPKQVKMVIFENQKARFSTITDFDNLAGFIDVFVDMFDGETEEDLKAFSKQIKAGRFGKDFGKPSSTTLGAWFTEFLDDKYEKLEQERLKDKGELNPKGGHDVINEALKKVVEDLPEKKVESQAQTHEGFKQVLEKLCKEITLDELLDMQSQYKRDYEMSLYGSKEAIGEYLEVIENEIKER